MLGDLVITNSIITRHVSNVKRCMEDDLVIRMQEIVLDVDRKDIR